MPGYNLPFLGSVPRNCFCPLCRLPMRDAVKINSCNHKYCDSCLQEFLSKGVFVCPKDQSSLEDTQVVADEKLDETVRSCRVSCPLIKDGCRWTGCLRDLDKHVGECSFSKVSCPRQCGVVVARRAVDNHMSLVCPRRKVICENCSQEFTGESYQTHSLSCRRGPSLTWCENKCGVRLDPSERRHHEERTCVKRNVTCQRCGRDFTADSLQLLSQPLCPLCRPEDGDLESLSSRSSTPRPQPDLEGHTHEKSCFLNKSSPGCPFKEYGCNVETNEDLSVHNRSACHDHLSMVLRVVALQKAEISSLRSEMKGLARATNGCYVWRIDDFARRFTEAQLRRQRGEPQLELLSEAFYTGAPFGYKLQASLFLDGNGPGAGQFISIYVKLLPGDFDQLLTWPFTQAVTFSLLDQETGKGGNGRNIEATFSPTCAWWAKQKKVSDDTGDEVWQPDESDGEAPLGFGFPKFVNHGQLFEIGGRFVRRDKLFLQIQVDNSTTDDQSKGSRFSSI